MKVKYVGTTNMFGEYPVYEDENGKLYFDISYYEDDTIDLHTGARRDEFGDFYGTPDYRVEEDYEVVSEF